MGKIVNYHVVLIYVGLAGLAVTAVWNFVAKRRVGSCCRRVELQSTITCPHCRLQTTETMPTDAIGGFGQLVCRRDQPRPVHFH